ncbi:uncharacterized protein EV420DRAFT_1769181 [Desarmillaria tabescens]|uniref:F-box domain-containing protein n=1 Tax=Armillaria tabescens TaxID=1929756 RepID=A0AA39JEZ9_ARMTA|nr:uncharacterized protein EV420DRAFT_1769181 [Desarmillaria tabescens]KAK0440862.1 hypothetical protein EV420DRAFT_1769181 [Desarmillaria tabescens]
MLSAVPPEILEGIVFELDHDDLIALRGTCKYFRDVATPFVFETIEICLHIDSRYYTSVSLLRALASGKTEVGQYIQTLRFVSPFDPPHLKYRRFWHRMARKRARKTQAIEKLLVGAIPKLIELRSLCWIGWSQGSFRRNSIELIMKKFMACRHLTDVSIQLHPNCSYTTAFSAFRNLTTFTFAGFRVMDFCPHIVGNCPNMTSLSVTSYDDISDSHPSIEKLLSHVPSDVELPLKSLFLRGLVISTSSLPDDFRHLRSLTALTLDMEVPDQFWELARAEGIKLVSVSVAWGNKSLLGYLRSYSGIELLAVTIDVEEADHKEERRCADDFYHAILPLHVQTLTELYIQPSYAGAWCLEEKHLAALLQCTKLTTLRLALDSAHANVEGSENIIVCDDSYSYWSLKR